MKVLALNLTQLHVSYVLNVCSLYYGVLALSVAKKDPEWETRHFVICNGKYPHENCNLKKDLYLKLYQYHHISSPINLCLFVRS